MSIFDQIAKPISSVVPDNGTVKTVSPAQNSVPSDPYFYKSFPSGATIGRSDKLDSSGKPFVGYRNPGDQATSTDPTRVATTFDPFVAEPHTADTFKNDRAVAGREALKKSMGGTYSDELDHKIALELSGSNDTSNLKIEPGIKGGLSAQHDKLENSLAKDVATGKKSLASAQAELLNAKGEKAPWEPAGVYVEKPGDKTVYDGPDSMMVEPHQSLIDELFNGKTSQYYKKTPEETGRYLINRGQGAPAEVTMYNPDKKQTDSTPTIMASGKKLYDGAIATSDYKMPLGTQIYIPQLNRIFTVEDRMNRRYSPETYGKIVFDIPTTSASMSSEKSAMDFGRQKLTYVVVGHDGRKETKTEE